MKNTIWFLLAAMVCLQGVSFANESDTDSTESSCEVASSQDRNQTQDNQGCDPKTSAE